MSNFLYAILGFVLAVGLLTTVHEFGHFWVARRLGVKVLRFSIGFGKPLITWYDKHGTEYVIAAIPFGGYVKMLDQNEGKVADNERHLAFNNKPVWERMLVIAAGPTFNFLFAVFAYWVVFVWGIASIVPVLGDIPKGSAAYTAGLRAGQEIIAVDNQHTDTWENIVVALVSNADAQNFVNVTVYDPKKRKNIVYALNVGNWSQDNGEENILGNLGLEPVDPIRPIVGTIMPDMPAAQVGLESGDEIISIDGEHMTSRSQVLSALRDKYDRATQLVIKRKDEHVTVLITPAKKILEGGTATGFIGIQFANQPWPENLIRTERYTPGVALVMALIKTKEYSVLTLQFTGKMVTGKMSLQHVAGPISIAKFAGRTVQSGIEYFCGFLALVSISLGVLNMLPIPVLDGGHFMFCVIELLRGKALSLRTIQMGQMLGFVILGSFMLLAIYNDLLRVMQ